MNNKNHANNEKIVLTLEEVKEYNDLDAIYQETDETIASVKEDGFDLNDEYEIIHNFAAYDFNSLEKMAIELFNAFGDKFEIGEPEEAVEEESNEAIFCFEAISLHKLDRAELVEEINKIVEISNECLVMYDGWGVQAGDEE